MKNGSQITVIGNFSYASPIALTLNACDVIASSRRNSARFVAGGVSKLSGEKYALAFNKIYGLPTTAIRPFNVYSPRQDPSNPYSGVM